MNYDLSIHFLYQRSFSETWFEQSR